MRGGDGRNGLRRAGPMVGLILAALLLAGLAGRRSLHLRTWRRSGLTRHPAAVTTDVPPVLTFATVALGGFRGVIADVLWLRVSRLQEQRRFVELVQLSDWITKLEPHLPEVWAFHAWNMAYNVSVLLPRPEDRWRWVRNGIALLRDEGIPLNPGSARLHRELGWLFQHKLGMAADPASGHYRAELARLMAPCLEADGRLPAADTPRAERLERETRMNPARMREIEDRFGPLDWRVPMAHSLYWGWCGLQVAGPPEQLPCRRMVYVSLIEMIRRGGRVVDFADGDGDGDGLRMRPETRLLEPTLVFLEETLEAHAFSGIRFAYAGLIRSGMAIRMAEGREADARRLHARLARFFSPLIERPFPSFETVMASDDALLDDLLAEAGFF